MQVIQKTDNSQTTASLKTSNMGLVVDSRTINLLLNNLYRDPYKAIIRELSANAVDAHNLIGNKNSFLIQPPSRFEPILKIRDFGPGLDAEEIEKYLNCLLSSNKSGDNNAAGGYGLGSKTPFALVDSFNVESVKNGIKYQCVWYREKGGQPVLSIYNTAPTLEENGLTFVININNNHIDNMIKAIYSELYHFPIKPLIVNCIDSKELNKTVNDNFIKASAPIEKYKNLTTYPTTGYNSRNFYVSIAGVVYDVSNLTSMAAFTSKDFKDLVYSNQCNYIVDLPIGSVTLPLNRESIEDTVANRDYINSNLKTIFEDYTKEKLKNFYATYQDLAKTKNQFSLKDYITLHKAFYPAEKYTPFIQRRFPASTIPLDFNVTLADWTKNVKNKTNVKISTIQRLKTTVAGFDLSDLLEHGLPITSIPRPSPSTGTIDDPIFTFRQLKDSMRVPKNPIYSLYRIFRGASNHRIIFLLKDTPTFLSKRFEYYVNEVLKFNTHPNTSIIVVDAKDDYKDYLTNFETILKTLATDLEISDTLQIFKMSDIPDIPKTVKAAKVVAIKAKVKAASTIVGVRFLTTYPSSQHFTLDHLYTSQAVISTLFDSNDEPLSFGLDYLDKNKKYLVLNKEDSTLSDQNFLVLKRNPSVNIILTTADKYDNIVQACTEAGVKVFTKIEDTYDSKTLVKTKAYYSFVFEHYISYFTANAAAQRYGFSAITAEAILYYFKNFKNFNELREIYIKQNCSPKLIEVITDVFTYFNTLNLKTFSELSEYYRYNNLNYTFGSNDNQMSEYNLTCNLRVIEDEFYFYAKHNLKSFLTSLSHPLDAIADDMVEKELYAKSFKTYIDSSYGKNIFLPKIMKKLNLTWI